MGNNYYATMGSKKPFRNVGIILPLLPIVILHSLLWHQKTDETSWR